MKEYIKPILEFVELRIEERLASCNQDPTVCFPGSTQGNGNRSSGIS